MLSVPTLLQRDKTCCWWVGGRALRAASEEGANKGSVSCMGMHTWSSQSGGCSGAGVSTSALPVLLMEQRGAGSNSAQARVCHAKLGQQHGTVLVGPLVFL